jgi:hypothetical protein
MKEVRKDGWLIRGFRDADEPAVVKVWHRSGRAAYTFLPTWQAFTLGQADRACAFYERHGFATVRFGTSPPPERAPDVEYHWRPRAQTRIEVGSAPRRDS